MHVLFLNQAFYPDIVATAQMGRDLADELIRRGHRVSAVASRSLYGSRGAVLPKRETVDGIEIHRVGAAVFGKRGYAARTVDFALFYLLAARKVLMGARPDVVVSYTTPPFVALTGLACRLFRGSRAVYWVMDLYPDLPVACGVMRPEAPTTALFERLNRFLLRHSDVNVVLGRCMRERVLAKGIPEERVREIPMWSDIGGLQAIERDASPYRTEWSLGDAFTVMYSGNFGIGHEAGTICRAMSRLQKRPDIRFLFVGGGQRREEVEHYIREHGIANAAWHNYVPRNRLSQSLVAADVHLISLKEGVEGIMVPSKLFGIMASGRPSIFIGHPDSEVARLLSQHGCGITIREGDDAGLTTSILRLKQDPQLVAEMGLRARRAVPGRFDRDTVTGRFADLLESLVPTAIRPHSSDLQNERTGAATHP
jgi:glycosyltransferase involved in cell wall biosynthesis